MKAASMSGSVDLPKWLTNSRSVQACRMEPGDRMAILAAVAIN